MEGHPLTPYPSSSFSQWFRLETPGRTQTLTVCVERVETTGYRQHRLLRASRGKTQTCHAYMWKFPIRQTWFYQPPAIGCWKPLM